MTPAQSLNQRSAFLVIVAVLEGRNTSCLGEVLVPFNEYLPKETDTDLFSKCGK